MPMIPLALPPTVLDLYRRELRALGIEAVDVRVAAPQGPRFRQMVARIGRWLRPRPDGAARRDAPAGASIATRHASPGGRATTAVRPQY